MGASQALASFFAANIGKPTNRSQVQQIAQQLDYMKRLRRNGGARDILDAQGIALLWGKGDAVLINQLGLGPVGDDEFIAYKPKSSAERQLIRSRGHPIR